MTLGSKREQVCQQFLLKTLDITQRYLSYTLSKVSQVRTSKTDSRGKDCPHNKFNDEIMNNLDTFIQKLPAVKSHYCRASSSKKYLPSEFQNTQRLYTIYCEHSTLNGTKHVGLHSFRQIFKNKYNLGFHLPKKISVDFEQSLKVLKKLVL